MCLGLLVAATPVLPHLATGFLELGRHGRAMEGAAAPDTFTHVFADTGQRLKVGCQHDAFIDITLFGFGTQRAKPDIPQNSKAKP